jgi:hypothetical protein
MYREAWQATTLFNASAGDDSAILLKRLDELQDSPGLSWAIKYGATCLLALVSEVRRVCNRLPCASTPPDVYPPHAHKPTI